MTLSRGEREMERSVLEEVCSNRKTPGSRERWQARRRARVTVSGLRSVQVENEGTQRHGVRTILPGGSRAPRCRERAALLGWCILDKDHQQLHCTV